MTVSDDGQSAPMAPVPIRVHIDAVRVAVGRVEAIVALLADWIDSVSWSNASPLDVERMIYAIDMIQEKAAAAVAAVNRFETLVADQRRDEARREPG